MVDEVEKILLALIIATGLSVFFFWLGYRLMERIDPDNKRR